MNTILSAPEHLAAFANTICGKPLHRRLGSTQGVLRRLTRVQQPPKTLVSRLKTANANFRERDECARSLRRGVGADVDTPARQPCCESRILALATDGERQLIIRYHDTRSSQALIDHGH